MRTTLLVRSAAAAAAALAVVLVPLAAGAEPGTSTFAAMPLVVGTNGTTLAPYAAIGCTSATSCTAFGPGWPIDSAPSSYAGFATATTETDGTWGAAVRLPLPTGVTATSGKTNLLSASCLAAGPCTAVGEVKGTKGAVDLVESNATGSWVASTVDTPNGTPSDAALSSVWCASAGNCVALGFYLVGLSTVPMVATETSGTWSEATALGVPTGSVFTFPNAIGCSSTGDCVAAGEVLSESFTISTAVWTQTSGTWSPAATLPKLAGLSFVPAQLACPVAGTCLVAGTLTNVSGSVNVPGVATDTSGTWAMQRIGQPELSPVTTGGFLNGLSCASATLCVAVGVFDGPGKQTSAGALTWDAGTWSSVDLAHSITLGAHPAGDADLIAVACPGPAGCIATGIAATATLRDADLSMAVDPVRTPTAPLAPIDVVGVPGLHRVTVRWSPPPDDGGAPITSYTATIYPSRRTCTTSGTACGFGSLVDGKGVNVRVTATNGTGTSAPSSVATFVPGEVPTKPGALRATIVGHVVELSWHAARVTGGERVQRYEVLLSHGSSARVVFTASTSCKLGVAAGRYRVVVEAFDATGSSPPAATTFLVS